MSPVVLVLVLVLVLLPAEGSGAAEPETSTGLSFVVAFPENVAHYHPAAPQNRLQLTALFNDTEVTITPSIFQDATLQLQEGESKEHPVDARMEARWWALTQGSSDRVLQVRSNKPIAVLAVSEKLDSVQTAVVLPTEKLAKDYRVPPVPEIPGTTRPAEAVTAAVTERAPFRLLVVNGAQSNVVRLTGGAAQSIRLASNELVQILLEDSAAPRSVSADQPVAVLFGHTCAMRSDCACGQLYAALAPAEDAALKFYIPPALANGTEAFVLLSEAGGTTAKAFDPTSPLVEAAGAAIFYRQGLLLPLIAESDFAACYVVHSVAAAQSSVLVVVNKTFTDGLHVGGAPVPGSWQELPGTDYAAATVELAEGRSFVWHAASKMAVYFMGRKNRSWFGNPAAVVHVGAAASGWKESLQYCKDRQMALLSFPEARHHAQISRKLLRAGAEGELWLGLRRSALSGDWYWLSGAPQADTNWEDGEPGTVHHGQCAAMSRERRFSWSDRSCCEDAKPVCYTPPTLLNTA
ncbi:C-type lectin lectoxin-Phi1 [Liparis tanakae]|uniref:C-type lectin lectoxin-Phi1 n=1 Tax=Liparis tanakae TaxID=230148 RepID=A0A4Z2ESK1_9TELE|nr:C-type lectin lectoxin-Phi1 [Liparis tanakae]